MDKKSDKKEYVADKALEAILEVSASDIWDKVTEELLEGYDGQKHEFSERHKEKMQELFDKARKDSAKLRRKIYFKRIAVSFIVVIAISTIAISSVSAWRVRFMNFILEITEKDTNITFEIDNSNIDSYKFDEFTFEYIPEGFKLEKSETRGDYVYISFHNRNKYFNFRTIDIESSLSIDTENAETGEIIINDRNVIYSKKDGVFILVWNDDNIAYLLIGNMDENELVKIAENIYSY
ncbi:MAG: DUF4367 domain-containing protein [Tissierellia bacterium]|nr:DUF4367 domain-containing protein [Tissierellia bacterium]MDD4781594.1 DUF4367 domain-containing protein [Tissierellia bacterium]